MISLTKSISVKLDASGFILVKPDGSELLSLNGIDKALITRAAALHQAYLMGMRASNA